MLIFLNLLKPESGELIVLNLIGKCDAVIIDYHAKFHPTFTLTDLLMA